MPDVRQPRIDLAELRGALVDRLETLAETLLGQRNRARSNRTQWRWGAQGSFSLEIAGRKRGAWRSHEAGEGGGPIELVQHVRRCSFDDAVAWAADFCGLSAANDDERAKHRAADERRRRDREHKRQREEAAAAEDERRRIAGAQRIWGQCLPIGGTVAERYLVETRGIPAPAGDWPDCVRFLSAKSITLRELAEDGTEVSYTLPCAGALVLAATAPDGAVHGVQRVYLDAEAQSVRRHDGGKVKLSLGVLEGAAARLPGAGDGPLLLAEGPETGLSVWACTGHETHVALGSLPNLRPQPGRRHVLCRDDDKAESPADKALRRLVARWHDGGADVVVANPWPVRRGDKSDFNDVLRQSGAEAVRVQIAAALNPGGGAPTPDRKPVAEARAVLDRAIAGWEAAALRYHDTLARALAEATAAEEARAEDRMPAAILAAREAKEAARAAGDAAAAAQALARAAPPGAERREARQVARLAAGAAKVARQRAREAAEDAKVHRGAARKLLYRAEELAQAAAREQAGPPPVHAIRVDVGVGKSLAARKAAARILRRMREVGDDRTVAIAVPTHRLGEEQAALFEAEPDARRAGLRAAIWRGREAPDPTAPGQTMCRDLEAVADAQEAMADVQTSVCRRSQGGETVVCPFFGVCGYQRQRETGADLWFVAHELLFSTKPAAVGGLAAVVVDETAWHAGLIGAAGNHLRLSLDALEQVDVVPGDPMDTGDLMFLRTRLHDVLRRLPDGPIPRYALLDADLTSNSASRAHKLEWRRKVDAAIYPGMPAAERRAASRAAAANKGIQRLAMLWHAVEALTADDGPAASGWAELAMVEGKEGPFRGIRLKGRRPIGTGWDVPALLLDATMQPDLLRPFWPAVVVTADALAEAPHQQIRQVVDRAYSKARLARRQHLRELHAILCREARRYAPGRVLVVVQIDAEEALPGIGPLPVNVELAHHNAVAGRDEWGPGPDRAGVAALIVVGRTAPPPAAVERMAEALTGAAVVPLEGWYERAAGGRETASGMLGAEVDRHPHPVAEAIRWQIAEGELVQIIGRGRGVNRTADNPLAVLAMVDAPLPLPVAETIRAADLAPGPGDLMLALAGIAFLNPTDAAAAYPSLWSNRNTAKSAFQRGGWVQSSISNSLYGNAPNLLCIEYQRTGAGRSAAEAVCDPALVLDPAAQITNAVGTLAWCKVDGVPMTLPGGEVDMTAAEIAVRPQRDRRALHERLGLPPVPDPAPVPPPPVETAMQPIPNPAVIAAMSDADKLAIRARIQAERMAALVAERAAADQAEVGEGFVPLWKTGIRSMMSFGPRWPDAANDPLAAYAPPLPPGAWNGWRVYPAAPIALGTGTSG